MVLTDTFKRYLAPFMPNLTGFFLTSLGVIMLVWVGWITFYDLSVWNKDLATILLGSRSGQALSLGIGMNLMYYLLIGLALIFSTPIMFFRKRGRV